MSQITAFSTKTTLRLKGNLVDLSIPAVMGVLNITPDSFYDGGHYNSVDEATKKAEKMLKEGALLLDVGGYSTRPGASEISEDEEIGRVVPVIEKIGETFPEAFISVDTFRSRVAREAIDAGACMINDVSGGNMDDQMYAAVAALQVPYVLMHMRGTPKTMTKHVDYDNLINDIIREISGKKLDLMKKGINDIIIDPGIGFAKTVEQNYEILRKLRYFKALEQPLLVGLSRKSMICKKLNIQPSKALNGTTVLNTIALMNGASILRVHDVKEAVEAINLFKSTFN